MTRHILFPYDGSKCAKNALNHVIQTATQFKAKVTAVKAYDLLVEAGLTQYRDFAPISKIEQALKESAQAQLEEISHQFKEAGVEIETKILKGYPGEEIVKCAENDSIDLIIMGTHGFGALKRFLLGSISHYVIHHADIPVLLVPPEKERSE